MLFPIEKKYTEDKFYFVLPVEKPSIPERVKKEAELNSLNEKSNYHISIFVEKNASVLRNEILKNNNPEKIKHEIVSLFNNFSWKYNLTDRYSLQEKFYNKNELVINGLTDEPEHTRRSIVQIVEMPDLELFYEKISALLNIKLDVPVPHITIFAWSDYKLKATRGIGISSKEDFEINNKKYF